MLVVLTASTYTEIILYTIIYPGETMKRVIQRESLYSPAITLIIILNIMFSGMFILKNTRTRNFKTILLYVGIYYTLYRIICGY